MFPNGALADKATVLSKVPAALTFTHVIETDENGEVMLAIQNLSALRTFNKIDKSLTDVERKQEELDAREEKDYQETIVWADSSTKYYHLDQNCKGVHDLYTDKMYLYQAEQEGYKPCNFCW